MSEENNAVNTQPNIPDEYKPISMWGYFGYEILFAIPCIGWICLIVFALGGTSNVNLKNFARSYFCFLILAVILGLIGFLLVGGITAAKFIIKSRKSTIYTYILSAKLSRFKE